jgi:hypothetical protein
MASKLYSLYKIRKKERIDKNEKNKELFI